MKRQGQWVVAGLSLMAGLVVNAGRADACGGFFCNQVPIDQSGEQIVFSVSPNHVTAHIQISFTGKAKDFAWVVPVQTKPTLSIGSQQVFGVLQSRTQPSYTVDWNFGSGYCGSIQNPTAGSAAGGKGAVDDAVTVVGQQDVGPYDTVTLASTDSGALVAWLNTNGFDQPASAVPLIDHYVKLGMYFVALKLKQDADVGEIQPIVLDMDNPEPCVPLILTRVAALPDMPVSVYVLGGARAFPKNWFEVEINPKQIDWLNNGANYKDVVTKAINEAAGHGFVTEFAGPSAFLKDSLYREGQWDLAKLSATTNPVTFVQLIQQMGFPRDQTMLALFRKHIPLPQSLKDQGVSEIAFYNNLAAYQTALASQPFDPAAFVADLQERVIAPLQAAQTMFDGQPYLTRLYSTVSPEEMTRDPLFAMNTTLPLVSNVHQAKGTGQCMPDGTVRNIDLTLEDGQILHIPGPWARYAPMPLVWTAGAGEPAARRIALVGVTGAPAVYTAAQAKVADGLLDSDEPDAVRGRVIAGDGKINRQSGCSFGGGAGGASLGLVAFGLALLFGRRRRSSR